METYTFIITQDELVEARLNTTEPFDRLFISKLPSEDVEIGYEVRDDVLTVKYEQLDNDRLMIANLSPEEVEAYQIPHIYGVVLKLHGVRKLKLGVSTVLYTDVRINQPCGVWHAVQQPDNSVIEHAVDGRVFVLTEDNRYTALSDEHISDLYHKYVPLGQGPFIPSMYLIRTHGYKYVPLNMLFHLPEVAHSFYPEISAVEWERMHEEFVDLCEELS